jgi:hypothetical protein
MNNPASPSAPPDLAPLRKRIAAAEAELHKRDAEHIRLCRVQIEADAALPKEHLLKLIEIAERYSTAEYAEERERQDDA